MLRTARSRLAGECQPPQIVWPRRGWASANAAMDQLFELFPDKYPSLLTETGGSWTFGLSWPRHLLEPIDPMLPAQARRGYGLELAQLPDYVEVSHHGRADVVFCMFHSRALLAPALVNAQRRGRPLRWVVHVDAHHDLAAPLLTVIKPGTLANPAFDIECRLDDPQSVTHVVDRGFVHKGSYLAAYILGVSSGHLMHICEDISPGEFWLQPTVKSMRIGDILVAQDSLDFRRIPAPGAWRIFELPRLPAGLPVDAADGVWLDVDLDGFCNRFDGDSDRRQSGASPAERRALEQGIASFLEALSGASWLRFVEAVSVAASPGFFPSAYWDLTIPALCEGIGKALSAA